MSDPRTPNISLWLPVPGERNWDVEVNQNWQLIDTAVGQLIAGSSNWHFTGAWLPFTNYTINQVVTYLGGSYLALANFTSGATFGTGVGETWGQIAAPGTSLNFLGAWSNVTAYNPYDLVTEAGNMYLALLAGTGHDPASSPTFWALVAAAGATGATGSTGAPGATGATGPAGTGASSFNQITAGTNQNQTLNVGNGSLLQPQGSGVINANELGGVIAVGGPNPALGKILISQGDGTAVWADPLCQGIQADGTAASTINPILVSGKGADNNQHNLKTDNSGVLQVHESGTATVHVDATTLAPVAIAGPVQVTDGLNHYQPTGDDPARPIHVNVDNNVTVGGAITVTQGTAAAPSGSWSVEVTDGTNVLFTGAHPGVVSDSSAVAPGATSDPSTLDAIAGKTVGGSPSYQPIPLTADAQAVNVNIHASEVGDAAEAATNTTLPSKTLWIGGSDGAKLQGLLVDGSGNLKVVASITGGTGTQYTGSPAVAAGSVVSTLASGYDGSNVRPLLISSTGQQHVIVDSGVASNASVSATGSAVPASATYIGLNIGGNLTGPTGLAVGSAKAMTVAIVDASGNQITSFGSSSTATTSGTVARVSSSSLTTGVTLGVTASGYATALVSLQITGGSMSSGAIVFEASDDGGTTYYPVIGLDISNSRCASDEGTMTVLNNFAPCLIQFPIAGTTNFRVRCTSTPSGATLTVTVQASNASMMQEPMGVSNFGTAPNNPQSRARAVNASIFHGTAIPSASNTDFNQISDGAAAMGTMANFGTSPTAVKSLNTNASIFAGTTALVADGSGFLKVNVAAGSISGTFTPASDGATGSAVPADASYIGVNIGGNLRGITGVNPAGSVYAVATAIVDGSGNQITSFGGGTQFADNAASGVTPTGTLSMGWDSANSKVRALKVDASQNLDVAVNAALPAGTNVIGHVITDSGSTTAVTGTVAVTESGTWSVRAQDGAGNALTSNSSTYTAKFGLDVNVLGTLGTAFSTAGKVDVKGADGDLFVRQATAANLNCTAVLAAGSAVIGHVITDSGSTTAVTGTVTIAGAVTEATLDAALISQEATTSGVKGLTAFGAVTTNAPSYTTAKSDALSLDTSGLLRVSLKDTPANTNKFLVTPDSVALPAHQSVNVDQLNGTTTDTDSGNKSAGTLRVVIATDQPALTNKLLVTPDANSSVAQGTAAASTASWYTRTGAPTTANWTQAAITFSSSGDNTIVTHTATQTIRVMRIFIVNSDATTATNVTFKDSTPTSFSGAFRLASGGSFAADSDGGEPLFVTASAKDFQINSSAAVQISGTIWYTTS